MYTFTIEQIEKLVEFGRRAGLRGMHLVTDDMTRAQRLCNGIGPEKFPPWARHLVGVICHYLVIISLPHDIEYQEGGGIWRRWCADWHFLCNGLRVAWYLARYMRLRKTAAIVAAEAVFMWVCLRLGGVAAFNWKHKRKRVK